MKKATAIVIVLIVLAMLFVFLPGRGTKKRLGLAPVGFTNSATSGMEALFLVRDFSDVAWNIFTLQEKSDAGWRHVTTPLAWSSYWRSDGLIMAVPVSSASNTWRVVLFCQERRSGVSGFVDRSKGFYERHVTKNVRERYDGRKYYVTNEVVP